MDQEQPSSIRTVTGDTLCAVRIGITGPRELTDRYLPRSNIDDGFNGCVGLNRPIRTVVSSASSEFNADGICLPLQDFLYSHNLHPVRAAILAARTLSVTHLSSTIVFSCLRGRIANFMTQ